uniref:Uncharacterized protein n=1 Tax=viral metagenome TaxID=1070528 RepID=A0A6C0HMC9_9ZZZZ
MSVNTDKGKLGEYISIRPDSSESSAITATSELAPVSASVSAPVSALARELAPAPELASELELKTKLLTFFKKTYMLNLSSLDLEEKEHNKEKAHNNFTSKTKHNGNNPNGNKIHSNHKSSNHKSTKKSNKPSKYKEYIDLIKTIYKISDIDENILFNKLYTQITDYQKKSQELQKSSFDNPLYYIDMHGGFNFEKKFIQVPDNIVIVFLTPVNRFGHTCELVDRQTIYKTFKNRDSKNKILNNILCIDKIYNPKLLNNQNNRHIYNKFHFFEKSIVLLPGQYYCDLNLSFSKSIENKEKDMDISYFSNNRQSSIILEDVLIYNNTLSSIINTNIVPKQDKLAYIFVDCCRNIDSNVKNNATNINALYGKQIYIYENFMLYFNTIMSKCNSIYKSNDNLPKQIYAQYKLFILHNDINMNNFEDVKEQIILKIKDNLTANKEHLQSYIKSLLAYKFDLTDILYAEINTQLLINALEIMYDKSETEDKYKIKILQKTCINFIKFVVNKYFNNIKSTTSYGEALKYIIQFDKKIDSLDKFSDLNSDLNSEIKTASYIQIILEIKTILNELLTLNFPKKVNNIKTTIENNINTTIQNIKTIITNIYEPYLDYFNKLSNKILNIRTPSSIINIYITPFKLINSLIRHVYDTEIIDLNIYLNIRASMVWQSIERFVMTKEHLIQTKQKGNKTLGRRGRFVLANELYKYYMTTLANN